MSFDLGFDDEYVREAMSLGRRHIPEEQMRKAEFLTVCGGRNGVRR